MSTNPGRQSGLMLVLSLAALAALALAFRSCVHSPPWIDMWARFPTPWSFGPFYGLVGIWGLIQVALAAWVGWDAHRRQHNGFLWALLVLFTGVIGLIVYLIVSTSGAAGVAPRAGTPPAPTSAVRAGAVAEEPRCPGCRARVKDDFKICPFCGASLRCRECDGPIEAGWKVCPRCAAPVAGT